MDNYNACNSLQSKNVHMVLLYVLFRIKNPIEWCIIWFCLKNSKSDVVVWRHKDLKMSWTSPLNKIEVSGKILYDYNIVLVCLKKVASYPHSIQFFRSASAHDFKKSIIRTTRIVKICMYIYFRWFFFFVFFSTSFRYKLLCI